MKSLCFMYSVQNIVEGRSAIMEEINAIQALLLMIVLMPVLVGTITLLLRKRIGVALVILTASALALSCMIVMQLQPIYIEDDRKCRFGGTQEQYLACKAERRAKGYSPSLGGTIAIVAVPTAVGVVGSMTVVYVSDRRKRHIIETTAN